MPDDTEYWKRRAERAEAELERLRSSMQARADHPHTHGPTRQILRQELDHRPMTRPVR